MMGFFVPLLSRAPRIAGAALVTRAAALAAVDCLRKSRRFMGGSPVGRMFVGSQQCTARQRGLQRTGNEKRLPARRNDAGLTAAAESDRLLDVDVVLLRLLAQRFKHLIIEAVLAVLAFFFRFLGQLILDVRAALLVEFKSLLIQLDATRAELVEVFFLLLEVQLLHRLGQFFLFNFFEIDLAVLDGVEQVISGGLTALGGKAGTIGGGRSRQSGGRPELGLARLFHLATSIIQRRPSQLRINRGQFLIVRRGDGHYTARLGDLGIGTFSELANFFPVFGTFAVAATLDRIDDDAFLAGFFAGNRIFDIVFVIHMRRRVANQEDDAQGLRVGTPLDLVDRIVERLIDALGRIAAALSLELAQFAVNGVEIVRQVDYLRDVGIRLISISNQADL